MCALKEAVIRLSVSVSKNVYSNVIIKLLKVLFYQHSLENKTHKL